MKTLVLKRGEIATVDDKDYHVFSKFKWRLSIKGYAIRGKNTFLHKEVCPSSTLWVDHVNGNRLDNRRSNLRLVTPSQNSANRKMHSNVRFKGVCKKGQKWQARIGINNKRISLGYYKTEMEAALAYNYAAKKYFGEFAKLNAIK